MRKAHELCNLVYSEEVREATSAFLNNFQFPLKLCPYHSSDWDRGRIEAV